ncbi:amidase [Aquincola sp. S2]|uniref:Amidase n=1 Tax=Pseudaquabacterium terrae TaxID=2732868 RepID=A0ABX2ECI9_9BURK|nr:amidase [Aquabacterium terrae]NRF66318.1 amidase [Aquabacterium terrae]
MTPDEYEQHDALGLAALVRSGEVDPQTLIDAAARRIDAGNPALNAVIADCRDYATSALAKRRAAGRERDGVFAGVPVLVKDLLATVEGLPTWHGNRLLQRSLPVATHDSEFIRRLRATGALIVGKTNTPEFGLTPFTEPELTGPTRNPWDTTRTAGGSSGGSAAAVAAGFVPLATGGDGGGSIRIPASCCGLFGLKPTRGRVPSGPDLGELWSGLAIEHGLTRTVRDSAALLDAVAGADSGPPCAAPSQARAFVDEVSTAPDRLRIGVSTEPWLGHAAVNPDCLEAVTRSAALLRSLGHEVIETRVPVNGEAFAMAFLQVLAANVRGEIETIAHALKQRARRQDYEATTWALGLLGRAVSGDEVINAQRTIQLTGRRVGALFESIDVLLTPTLATPPPLIGALKPTPAEQRQIEFLGAIGSPWLLRKFGAFRQIADKAFDFIPYTAVFNGTGQPAMSVPLHWNAAGLPIGVQFVGRFGDEATLFRLAGQLEAAQPWVQRRPPRSLIA